MKIKNTNNFWELATDEIHKELTQEESKEFELLLKEKSNKELFQDIINTNKQIQKTKFLKQISSEKSYKLISDYLQKKKIRLFINFSKYAAIILLAFTIGSAVNITNYFKKQNSRITEFNVPLGQMSQIILSDGTKVWLNSGTTLKYENNFGENFRNVSLNGEAFFKVKPGQIPFKVKLKHSEIEVLGTSFNAISYNDEDYSRITLVKGKVKINNPLGKEISQLNPTDQITIPDNLQNIKIQKVNTDFFVSWTDGKIVFEEMRLADIVEKLERWYNVEIQLSDEQVRNYRFSGTILKNKPFNQITKAFELLLPVQIKYTNNIDKKDLIQITKK